MPNLTRLVGELVSNVADRHRNDCRCGHTGQEPQHREHGQIRDKGTRKRSKGEERQTDGHHPEFADSIAERSIEQLEQSVRQRIGGNNDGGVRRNRSKVFGDYMKEGVHNSGIRLNHERRQAKHEQRSPTK